MQRKIATFGLLYSLFLFPVVSIAAEPVQLIAETSRSISFTVDVPEPVFLPVGDGGGVACSVEGFSPYHALEMPSVVMRGVMAAIPAGARLEMNISVNSSQFFKNIDLAPVPTLASDSFRDDTEAYMQYVKDPNVYSRDEYFPARHAEIAYTGNLRGTHFAQILITPVQYNPVQRIVRVVRSMTVTLFFDGIDVEASKSSVLPETPSARGARTFDTIRNAALLNPESDFMDMRLRDCVAIQKTIFNPCFSEGSNPSKAKIIGYKQM